MKNKSFISKVNYFIRLRTNSQPADNFNMAYMPANLAEAYAIQAAVIAELGLKVLGWKLGGTNPKTQTNFECSSGYLGPIFSVSDDEPAFIDNSALRGEAELTFRINNKISDLSLEQIEIDPLFYFDAVYPSLELPYSQINNFHEVGMLPLVADLCGTGHLAIGDSHTLNILKNVKAFNVKIKQEEAELASGGSDNLIGGYQTALYDFLKLILTYDIAVEAGQLVATGGITDCIYLAVNENVEIDFFSLGKFNVFYS